MSQGSIANTELIELAKVGCFVANLVQSLNAEWRDQLALLEGLEGVGAVDLFGEMTGIGCLQPSHDIDLIQRELNAYGLVRKVSTASKETHWKHSSHQRSQSHSTGKERRDSRMHRHFGLYEGDANLHVQKVHLAQKAE
ncbi:hypothetical protein HG531_004397 [Fusarium graminearum]|nr:hypothetical protein HG531_004397 [Fusarium graminearum]